jgi:TolB-like protein/DNA-binding winged helix-turn-helix (wHTH) protein
MPVIWVAGDLCIDTGLQRVEQAGVSLELPKLTFELLIALLQAAPNFVSNDELMSRVWPGLVVSPETVTQRVKLLRDALGDDPRNPRYIEGLRSRGYRILPPVVISHRPLSAPAVNSEPAPAMQRANRARRVYGWAFLVGLCVILSVWGLVRWRTSAGPSPTAAQPDRTAAVLNFKAVGGDPADADIALGVAESVQSRLVGVRGLSLIARDSSLRLNATTLGPQATGNTLGAGYLIEGTVEHLGHRLRVVAHVIDSHHGTEVWTQQFDGGIEEFFDMQDRVATGVARALESRIAGIDPSIPAGERSQNLDAYIAFLHGRALLDRYTISESEQAANEFARATQLDPNFSAAYAALFDARAQAASLRRTGLAKAIADYQPLLDRALQLQPRSGAVYLAKAMWTDSDDVSRERDFRRGLELDTANARGMTAYSEFLDDAERRADGAEWLSRALRIDPLSPRAHFREAQRNFQNVGSAIEFQTLKVLELDPTYYPALQRYSKYQWLIHGNFAQAVTLIERAIRSDPQNPWGIHTAVAFYLDLNDPAAAEELAAQNGVANDSSRALRATYAGNWREAGEAALQPGSWVMGGAERWGVVAALRDYALRTGKYPSAERLISERYDLPLHADWKLDAFNFREAQLLAHLQMAQGDADLATRHLHQVVNWIDGHSYMGPVFNLRTKAQALALEGRNDEALSLLVESFRQSDYTFWWYTLQRDPTWDLLRRDPRFVNLAASVRSHADRESGLLAQMRSTGAVPNRDASDSAKSVSN